MRLSVSFLRFFDAGKAGGLVLVLCTLLSLAMANSAWGPDYLGLWKLYVAGLSLEHWANDGLMAIFFLLIGLELERELYRGELSSFRNALLPIFAALGGIVVPALLHFSLNVGTPGQAGAGIPMATDIAFALGVLALLGSRVPASLKVFLTALAVMDDLGAIVVIALFYSGGIAWAYLLGALAVFGLLLGLNLKWRVMALWPYVLGGILMWGLMLCSGVHATIAGVLLAFAIPFKKVAGPSREPAHPSCAEDEASPSHRLEHLLHKPVTFLVLPVFALANTGVVLAPGWWQGLVDANSLGIFLGLGLGKPLGIFLASYLAVALGVCRLPADLRWAHIVGAGFLGGIGFTMSIFITNLAFAGQASFIDASKMAILLASVCAGGLGGFYLSRLGRPRAGEND